MIPERAVEGIEPARLIVIFQSEHFLENIGMAADRSLAELDQAARNDIGAFHSYADRDSAIEAAEVVVRPFHDRLAAVHIHRVVDRDTQAFSGLRFHDRGNDRRLVAGVECSTSHSPRGIDQIRRTGEPSEPLLDGLEFADRDMELLADPRVGTGVWAV